MSDLISQSKRSALMARIRRKNTKPERQMARALASLGLAYEAQQGIAHVDFAFPSAKVALFVDGCFWHGCPKHRRAPASHKDYWEWKVRYNRERDHRLRRGLRSNGWVIFRVWEHSLPKFANRYARLVEQRIRHRTG